MCMPLILGADLACVLCNEEYPRKVLLKALPALSAGDVLAPAERIEIWGHKRLQTLSVALGRFQSGKAPLSGHLPVPQLPAPKGSDLTGETSPTAVSSRS